MIIKITPDMIVQHEDIKNWCTKSYPGHPQGCPNYGKKEGCPPGTKFLDEILDFNKDLYLIYVEFEIGKFAERMRSKHPDWSDRQAYCCLYWQGKPRKQLKEEAERAIREYGINEIAKSPEANGVNMFLLFRRNGIILERNPRQISRHATIGGYRLENSKYK